MQSLLLKLGFKGLLGLTLLGLAACGGSSSGKGTPTGPNPTPAVSSASLSSPPALSSLAQVSSLSAMSIVAISSVQSAVSVAASSVQSSLAPLASASSMHASSVIASSSVNGASSAMPPASSVASSVVMLSSSSAAAAASSAVGLAARPSNISCLAPAVVDAGALAISWPVAFPSLPFLAAPVGLFQLPGDNAYWYALDQSGVINRFSNQADVKSYSKMLDIKDRVSATVGGETGLLGVAVHPGFNANRYVFLYYTGLSSAGALESRIARYKVNVDGGVDKASELLLLSFPQPYNNHNGGQLAFGPDGYLYIASGDGGAGGDPHQYGQNKNVLLGKILRIDVNKTSTGRNYAIPADNPFVGSGDARPEIWAYGLRNPWRFSFDSVTGDLWAGDVGQSEWEEINLITRGANYGWGDMEGDGCYSGRPNCSTSGKIKPRHAISHTSGVCSVIGGYVYRGSAFPSAYGKYFFTDYCVSNIQALSFAEDNRISVSSHGSVPAQIVSFAQDAKGELYAIGQANMAGRQIFKMQVSGGVQPGVMASHLSATGCVDAAAPKQPAAGLIPYKVSSPLWSDGAEKERYFALPDNSQLEIDSSGDFQFPLGSVLVKHFKFSEKFIETRLFARGELGWQGFSYEWLDDQSDALLLSDGKDKTIGSVKWRYPSRDQCLVCHTRAAHFALGPETLQLNTDLIYPASGVSANQLASLSHIGLFSNTSPWPLGLAALDDASASLDTRARSYLHSNCSGCHRPGGNTTNNLDFRFTASLAETHACNQVPSAGNLTIANPLILAPGEPQRSVLLARMKTRGGEQMPPLATSVVDAAAVQVIGDWIASLQSCD